jgi:branched-chain amino acid aminotransferase
MSELPLVMIDGLLVAPEQARVSVFDRGFLYGDSIFETLRTYGGRPFAVEEHLVRLEASAARTFLELPLPRAALADEIRRAVAAAGHDESVVRLMVTRGQGPLGLDPSLAGPPLRVVLVTRLVPPPAAAYERGVAVVTMSLQRVADGTPAEGAKVGNYLVAVLAMRRARAAGAAEALIVDARGRVVEGASSNLFLIRGGRLVTAPEDAGILPGITRARVLDAAHTRGMPIELRAPSLEELFVADELFVSSSLRELLPVVSVDGRQAGGGRPGEQTRELLATFRRNARKDVGL